MSGFREHGNESSESTEAWNFLSPVIQLLSRGCVPIGLVTAIVVVKSNGQPFF
jgi:hypothetical protein